MLPEKHKNLTERRPFKYKFSVAFKKQNSALNTEYYGHFYCLELVMYIVT